MRHRLFRKADAALVPFSLVWFGFSMIWLITARSGGSGGFPLFGLLFAVLGIYMAVARFVVRSVASRRTVYTVTDSRVVVRGGMSGGKLTTAYLRSLPPPVITERPDGSGSLAFGAFPGVGDIFNSGRRSGWSVWSAEPSGTLILWEVPDVRRVRDFIAYGQRAA